MHHIFKNAVTSLRLHSFSNCQRLDKRRLHKSIWHSKKQLCLLRMVRRPCNYPCEVGAKSSSHVTTIPAAMNTGLFDMRLDSYVFRIDTDSTGKATGVRYYDATGKVHVQPAKVVFNGLWGYNLIRSMLLSGIGTPYNPINHTGSLGRGLTNGYYPTTSSASVQLNVGANTYCQRKRCWRRIRHHGP